MYKRQAEEHRIDFLLETEKQHLYLWVDVDKLEKIVFNLLSNAFKYTPNGKMITIFIREDENTVSIGVQDLSLIHIWYDDQPYTYYPAYRQDYYRK